MNPRVKQLLAPLASLKLTVALFAASMILIFAGTLAQRDIGNWQVVHEYFRSFWVMIPLRHLLFVNVRGVLPFPGGFVLLSLLLANLIAAHIVRFQLTRKRAGVLVLHAGLILLLVGELITAAFAEEGMMMLVQGSHSSYVHDLREVELAVIEPGEDENREQVTVIPESLLRQARGGEPITHELLPFDLSVSTWLPNSGIVGPRQVEQMDNPVNPATAGVGRSALAVPVPLVTGVDTQEANQPAAYVTLHRDGERLDTYLVSTNFASLTMFEPRQTVEVDGRTYEIELRFKRMYLPYTLHLLEARHDTFVGTDIPRNFSSLVRLDDPAYNEDRQVLIYMNHPLRYRGQTFFQAQMGSTAEVGGVPVSGLQVVTNPGWLLPYISCALVALGLTLHFGIMLAKFTRRGPKRPAQAGRGSDDATSAGPGPLTRILPRSISPAALGIALIAVVYLGAQLRPQLETRPFDLRGFASLPVTAEGRVKPFDTVARNALMAISGRQSHREDGQTVSAIQWMLEVLTRPEVADQRRVFRVDHPDVKDLIGVDVGDEDRKRFSFNEIMAHREAISEQATRADAVAARQRNGYQRHLIELTNHLTLYGELRQLSRPYAVPPTQADQQWQPLGQALHAAHGDPHDHVGHDHPIEPLRPAAALLADMLRAYHTDDAAAFNRHLDEYETMLADLMPGQARKTGVEVIFNRFAPFYQGTVLYVAVLLLGFGSVLLAAWDNPAWARRLATAAVSLLVVTFALHTLGIVARIYLEGRPPVTNLYSSAVFIGWVCILMGLFIERFYRSGLATIVSAFIGFVTLIIAHNLAAGGDDTMQVMQAVLDSNFWLATHVITVTIGYAATFLAGAIGIALILMGVYTTALTRPRFQAMGKMMYGTIAFALLFSFVGTVLGGIWADQSWGRFWGWDPKENGAVLIVLMNALILHARWDGLIQQRGIAVLAVGGNIITAWSWFGTNMLGVGLHSYGFMDSALFWILAFAISQIAIMSVGMIPMRRWASMPTSAATRAARLAERGGGKPRSPVGGAHVEATSP